MQIMLLGVGELKPWYKGIKGGSKRVMQVHSPLLHLSE